MTIDEIKANINNIKYLNDNQFEILGEISRQFYADENNGRDLLIHLLEHKECFLKYENILNSLIEMSGLIPYVDETKLSTTGELLAYEFHRPIGLEDIVLHSLQMEVYQQLLDGENVILSAPTSFGKSLLIDAMIASNRYKTIIIIVPTIALIDETRSRLSDRFRDKYKIITHPSQQQSERNIYVLTQERYLEFRDGIEPDFFVVDEFYKMNHGGETTSYDERVVSLNSAFLRLCYSKAQFLLIGPNVDGVKTGKDKEISFKFIRTDFKTVATDIEYIKDYKDPAEKCLDIIQSLNEQTLVFCKSPASAISLANKMLQAGVNVCTQQASELAEWLKTHYHQDWDYAKLLEHGIALHYSALPRAISHYVLKLFNEGYLRFILCTSTIIEGVNTSAKNIIIYDNKIAKQKFDFFTYNNIKGRAGRMFRHFVGKVFVLNEEPSDQLPLIDIPALTIPEDIPVTLALDLPEHTLSEFTKEQLRKLHAQDYLDVSIIKKNSSVSPELQVETAKVITENIDDYEPLLNWDHKPTRKQLQTICSLIFDKLLDQPPYKDGVSSAKQLNYLIRDLQINMPKGISSIIEKELHNPEYKTTPTIATEKILVFLRQWGEYNFPRLLNNLNDIQQYVFSKHERTPGDYSFFSDQVKHWFLHPAATLLEEYGIPFQITLKICEKDDLGNNPDEILSRLKKIKPEDYQLEDIEINLLNEALQHI